MWGGGGGGGGGREREGESEGKYQELVDAGKASGFTINSFLTGLAT